MDEKLLLETIVKMFDEQNQRLEERFTSIDDRFTSIDEQLADIKEDVAITRAATNSLVAWADEVSVITQVKFPVKRAK